MIVVAVVPFGYVAVVFTERGVAACSLAERMPAAARAATARSAAACRHRGRPAVPMTRLLRQLSDYLAGAPVRFDYPLDLELVTPFRRRVMEATRRIPYGEVRSYGWVAKEIGQPGAAHAVGQALHRNPLPMIVPCHRVVGYDGALVGFGDGPNRRRRLLALEGR